MDLFVYITEDGLIRFFTKELTIEEIENFGGEPWAFEGRTSISLTKTTNWPARPETE